MASRGVAEEKGKADSVIVRAFGNEPVRLVAVGTGAGWVEVANAADRTKTVGFPAESVYRFDGELFDQLKEAYEGQQTELLAVLWKRATPFAEVPTHS